MHKKKIAVILLSVIFVIALCFGINLYITYRIGYTDVYIASHNLSQRKIITQEDIVKIRLPKDCLSDDMYINKDDILDKYVKLSYSIPKGSFIYKSAIETDIKDYANTLLNENEVNYDLFTSDIKINTANLAKNMYIDLYLTIKDKDLTISDLLISNLRITGLYDPNNKLIPDYDNESRVYIISVAVDNKYVSILNKAEVLGQLSSVISNNAYDINLKSKLNENSKLIEYLY